MLGTPANSAHKKAGGTSYALAFGHVILRRHCYKYDPDFRSVKQLPWGNLDFPFGATELHLARLVKPIGLNYHRSTRRGCAGCASLGSIELAGSISWGSARLQLRAAAFPSASSKKIMVVLG
jgi:hypothetical protein